MSSIIIQAKGRVADMMILINNGQKTLQIDMIHAKHATSPVDTAQLDKLSVFSRKKIISSFIARSFINLKNFMFILNLTSSIETSVFIWLAVEVDKKFVISRHEMWCSSKYFSFFVHLFSGVTVAYDTDHGACNSLPFQVIIDILWLYMLLLPSFLKTKYFFACFRLLLSTCRTIIATHLPPVKYVYVFIPQILFRSLKCRHEWVKLQHIWFFFC